MKVTLNIENDAEMRAYVKDCIKGQVLSIVREEMQEMIKEELNRKIKGLNDSNFQRIFTDAMVKNVKDILQANHNVKSWDNNWIKPIIASLMEQYVKQNESLINQLAKEKVKLLVG
jgi:hypothetical protein